MGRETGYSSILWLSSMRSKKAKFDDLLHTAKVHLQAKKFFRGYWLKAILGRPMGEIRQVLHVLNREGFIRQCDRTNHSFGGDRPSVHRGAGRTWEVSKRLES